MPPATVAQGIGATDQGAVESTTAGVSSVQALADQEGAESSLSARLPMTPGRGPAIPSDPLKCVCAGDALQKAMTRQWSSFTIEGFTAEGNRQTQGGELFVVSVRGASVVSTNMIDNQDGSYVLRYRAAVSGTYSMSITLHGYPLAGSPFTIHVLSRAPDPQQSKLKGSGLHKAVAREPTAFEIEFVDCFGQVTHAEELDVHVEWVGDPNAPVREKPSDDADAGKRPKGKAGEGAPAAAAAAVAAAVAAVAVAAAAVAAG